MGENLNISSQTKKKKNYKNILFYRQGFLDAEMLRTVLHAHHVPLPDDLLRAGISM